MSKVSVIVPVYNVEKYLNRCIDSILAQTFTDFELILVDDGSPDRCGEICDEYAEKDSRIKVIHKKNGGVSKARNVGIEAAQGKYIMFCDSDDFVDKHFCEYMYRAAEENPNAMICCERWTQDSENAEWKSNSDKSTDDYEAHKTGYYEIHKRNLSGAVWNKIFKRDELIKNSIYFEEGRKLGEDVIFAARYAALCEEVVFIPLPLYYYACNGGGAVRKYYPNLFELHLPLFSLRLPLIDKLEHSDYCDSYLYYFVQMLENTMDKRNKMSFFKKLAYNQKMMRTEEFAYCVNTATGKNDSEIFMKILRMRNYYILYLFNKLTKKK